MADEGDCPSDNRQRTASTVRGFRDRRTSGNAVVGLVMKERRLLLAVGCIVIEGVRIFKSQLASHERGA